MEGSLHVDLTRPYFIGIGGAGMSGIAAILRSRGMNVSGSDAAESPRIENLREFGCKIHADASRDSIEGASCVIVSQAIKEDHPELQTARALGVRIIHRAEALAAVMDDYRSICIAGTHGKSSTSAILSVALHHAGVDPSFVIGADLEGSGRNARQGSGVFFVAEADESDRSFHFLHPAYAVVLNIEEDHHDHYSSLEEHIASYETFVRGMHSGGTLVISADNPGTQQLIRRLLVNPPAVKIISYGESAQSYFQIRNITSAGFSSQTTVQTPGGEEQTFTLNVPGAHIAHNAVAAFALGIELGVDSQKMAAGIAAYHGIERRLSRRGEAAGILVVDSYAHHPTEIAADLETARQIVRDGRIFVIFQPHLPSRTQALGVAIGESLAGADVAVIMDIYEGREAAIHGVTSSIVADAALQAGTTVFEESDRYAIPKLVAALVRPGDLVLTMGAGDVTNLCPALLAEIGARS